MKVRLTFTGPRLEALGCSRTWRTGLEIRRRVLAEGQEQRLRSAASSGHPLGYASQKILVHQRRAAWIYRRTAPRPRPKIDPLLPVIHQILDDDKKAPQEAASHCQAGLRAAPRRARATTAKPTIVKEAVAAWRRTRREVFVPLSHPPGEAQVVERFGQAEVTLNGAAAATVTLFVMNPRPTPDALFVIRFSPRGAPRPSWKVTSEPSTSLAAASSAADQLRQPQDRSGQDHRRSPSARSPTTSSGSRATTSLRTTSASSPATQRERACRNLFVGYARRNFLVPRAGSPRRAGVAQHRPGKPLSRRPPPPAARGRKPVTKAELARGGAVGPVATVRPEAFVACPGRSDHGRFALPGPLRHQRLLSPPTEYAHHQVTILGTQGSTPSGLSLATAWWRVTVAAGAAGASFL